MEECILEISLYMKLNQRRDLSTMQGLKSIEKKGIAC